MVKKSTLLLIVLLHLNGSLNASQSSPLQIEGVPDAPGGPVAHQLVRSSSHDVLKSLNDSLKQTNKALLAQIELLNTRARQLETDYHQLQQTHEQFKQQHAVCSQSQSLLSKHSRYKLNYDDAAWIMK